MRYIPIEKTEQDMILARSVYDNTGRVLLSCGTVLTDEYIDKLYERGLPGIYIEDKLAEDIEIEEAISEELRNEGAEALRNGDVDAAMSVGRRIVDEIIQNPRVTLDLIDLRSYDDYTYRHSVNVAVISTVIGINMQLNRLALDELSIAAILHDIGKRMIDPKIINKKGKLTPEEYTEVKRHSEYGYEMVKSRIDLSAKIKNAILLHHENEDGSGYPKGLKGNQIFIYAKIIHVADVFDALTAKRPYKKAYAQSEAAEYLMGSCDRMFDREVVKAFLQCVSLYPKGTQVQLSNGKEALVVEATKSPLRPKVRIIEDGTDMDLSSLYEHRNITIVPPHDGDIS